MTVSYNSGDFLVIKNGESEIQYEILECGINQIRIKDTLQGIESARSMVDIDELVVSGKAVIHQRNLKERKLQHNNAADFASYPEKARQSARDRYKFVINVLDSQLPSHSVQRVTPVIEQVWNSHSFEVLNQKPSARSVQRWIKSYIEAGKSIRGLVTNNQDKGNRNPKVDSCVEAFISQAIANFKQLEQPSIAKSYDYLKTLIHYNNISINDESRKLKVMNQSAFIKRLEKEAKKELMIARMGKKEANKAFKTAKLPQEISLILQRVESDHTQLDLFIVDEKESMILGRPYVTAILDYKSKCILGFYIGFEKPSYLSIARALRHAILPKSYVKELYKDVENEWECYGVPRVLVVDRGKDFESVALRDACLDLNIRIQKNPGKHPWYKGSIESYFKSINNGLLNDMKGKVFPNIVETNAYNPQKHAVITMGLFLKIFHIWLIDIYHQNKVSRGTIIPKISWREDLERVPRRVINKDALDIVLAEKATRKNSKDGIVIDHIRYACDELTTLRDELGCKNVQLKYNREDLGYIYVLDERNPRNKVYLKVPALNQKYAKGLSKHQHQVIVAFNKKYLDGQLNLESLALAKMKIKQLIEEHLESRKEKLISTNQNIARLANAGQQSDQSVKSSIFNHDIESPPAYEGLPKPSVKHSAKEANSIQDHLFESDNSKEVLPSKLNLKKRRRDE